MLKRTVVSLRGKTSLEQGLGIVEILVAVTIIVIALVSSAFALSNTFEAQSVTESRNRAVAIAQDRIAQAQLVSYREVGFPKALLDVDQTVGGLGGITTYNGETIKTIDVGETAFAVKPYEEIVVGKTDLEVSTYVTSIRPNTFDGTIESFIVTDLAPRRVTVVVNWTTKDGVQSVVRSLVKYPSPTECAPAYTLQAAAVIPEGCVNPNA